MAGLDAGVLFALAGVVAWAWYSTSRAAYPQLSLLRFTALTAALGTVSILAVSVVLTLDAPLPTLAELVPVAWQVAYMALPATVAATLMWNQAVVALGPVNGVLFINLVPVTALIIEALRGAPVGGGQLAGVVVVVGALVALNVIERRSPVPPPIPPSAPAADRAT